MAQPAPPKIAVQIYTQAIHTKMVVRFMQGEALENTLAQRRYLLGQDLTVLDIAWFIYAHRLSLAGYPFARLHPRVDAFVRELRARPEFAKEVATPPEFDAHLAATRKAQSDAGKSLEMVAGF